MVLDFDEIQVVSVDNAPRLAGSLLRPRAYSEKIVEDFTRRYRLLMQLRAGLVGPRMARGRRKDCEKRFMVPDGG